MQVRDYSTCSIGNYYQNRTRVSFGEARINIFATADNHGKFQPLSAMFSNVQSNINEIFPEKDSESTLNIGVFDGDWFMSPSKKDYISNPNKSAGEFQLDFLNKFISLIKEKVPNFRALYVPGNHCLDGGDNYLLKLLSKADVTTIFSNANFNLSPALKYLPSEQKNKIKQYEVLEVPDDKNPNLTHKALILGINIMGVDFYNPDLVNDLEIFDRTSKKDADIKDNDINDTVIALKTLVQRFKKKNPNGAVIIMSHTGGRISEMIARRVPGINLILNGHDHENKESIIKYPNGHETRILSLWHDSKKFESIKLHFNDKGHIDNLNNNYSKTYYSHRAPELENDPIAEMIDKSFAEDRKPLLFIKGPANITKMKQTGVRSENNLLANFVNDAVFASIKKYVPDVQIYGVASSAFRQDLKVNGWNTNMELRNVLNGQTDSISIVNVGNVKGAELARMILENIKDHIKDMERNTIVQWSGVQIHKQGLIDVLDQHGFNGLNQAASLIQIKNDNGIYEPLDLEKSYKMALPNYFFKRNKIPTAMRLKNNFVPINKTISELFKEYIDDNRDKEISVPDIRDVRIVSEKPSLKEKLKKNRNTAK